MAHRDIEQELDRLNHVRELPPAEAVRELRKALADRVNLVTAKAAKLAGEMRLDALAPDLHRAFDRLMEKPKERDPQCWGKAGIAQALAALEVRESAAFIRGLHHIQMEPVWGGEEDTAGNLRATCALALAACTDLAREDALRHLVDVLADRNKTVRVDAARAVAQLGGDEAALLLRLKARLGDRELEVVGQVFDALLALERERAIEFVADFLHSESEDICEEACLALGSSRLPGTIELLEQAWERARGAAFRAGLLRALSASREPRAIEFLLRQVRGGRAQDAQAALEALALHGESPEIARQAREAAEAAPALREGCERLFGAGEGRPGGLPHS